jgi:hypothetical protein
MHPSVVAPPPAHHHAPAPSRGLPTWLMAIIFTFAFIGLVGGVYWAIQHFRPGGAQSNAPMIAMENPAGKAGAKIHPLQKYIEVAGIRFQLEKKKTEARFVVINHSEAPVDGLAANVNVWGRTAKSDEEPVGSFSFKVPSLGPNEAKDVTVPLNTKLKVYELPDWQNVNTEVQITAP